MSAIPLELRCVGTAETVREDVTTLIRREGLAVARGGSGPPRGPSLLLFDRVDEGLCASVRELSRQGTHRVLAVALRRQDLSPSAAWRLFEAGAADVFAWDDLAQPVTAIGSRFRRFAEVDALLATPLVRDNLVGESPAWQSALRQVIEVARFTDASLLLTGESGTGKELAARLIHSLDPRDPKGRLVVLDCATVVPELSGSEFFGHERGAFTHAISARDGAFALADGGTLFLDEIGELPMTLQAELLRVVQERSYKRVGSNTWHQVNFRLICATNRDLLAEEGRGNFRRDLYYRIASWTCTLPPLRQRQADILTLARHFLAEVFGAAPAPDLDPLVREYLQMREYPGNVRELRQLVHRMAKRHVGPGPLTPGDLPEEERQPACRTMQQPWCDGELRRVVRRALAQGAGLKELTAQTAELAIQTALEDEGGSVRRAALRLRVTDRAIQMRRAASQRSGADTQSIPRGGNGTAPPGTAEP